MPPSNVVHDADFGANNTVATAHEDGGLRVWRLQRQPTCQALWQEHKSSVFSCECSRSGRILVSASFDQTVKVWDAFNQSSTRTLVGHTHWVWDVHLSNDDQYVVSCGNDGTCRIWSLAPNNPTIQVLRQQTFVSMCRLSRDNQRVVTCSGRDNTRVWDVETGKQVSEFESAAACCDLDDSSTLLLLGYENLSFLDVRSNTKQKLRSAFGVASCCFIPHSYGIVSGGESGWLQISDLRTTNTKTISPNQATERCKIRRCKVSQCGMQLLTTRTVGNETALWAIADPTRPQKRMLLANLHWRMY